MVMFEKNTVEHGGKRTAGKGGECAQLGEEVGVDVSPKSGDDTNKSRLRNPLNKFLSRMFSSKSANTTRVSSLSTTTSLSLEKDKSSSLLEGDRNPNLPPHPQASFSAPHQSEVKYETSKYDLNQLDLKFNVENKKWLEDPKILHKSLKYPKLDAKRSLAVPTSGSADHNFASVCKALYSNSHKNSVSTNLGSTVNKLFSNRNFTADLKLYKNQLTEEEENQLTFKSPRTVPMTARQRSRIKSIRDEETTPRRRGRRKLTRVTVGEQREYEDSDSSSTLSSTTKETNPTDSTIREHKETQGTETPVKKDSVEVGRPDSDGDFELDFEIDVSDELYDGHWPRKRGMKRVREFPSSRSTTMANLTKYIKQISMDKKKNEVNVRMDRRMLSEKGPKKLILDRDILEDLDKIGGIKYDGGNIDLRRKYKSFEQLCFGLGCIVAPTRQELEMCAQLSMLGDESTLSDYETAVYQSCLLRSRAFESIWKKFCNRVIGIMRKYLLQGIYKLLRVIELEPVIEPFLKVILINVGRDRQDQQLLLNILKEELVQIIKNKFILIQLNNNSVDEIILQMYIQLYQYLLLMEATNKNANQNPDQKTAPKSTNPDDKNNTWYIGANPMFEGVENALEKLLDLYNENFREYELILIVNKFNPTINEIMYLFQLLKRRKLLPINSILMVSPNNMYLENYCSSRIYSNLAIFECDMVNVGTVVDDILQVLMFDSRVQDFVVNFHMLSDIFEHFSNTDNSLTLLILRVYQLYEQYYNRYIFSYLSIVPSFVYATNFESVYSFETVPDISKGDTIITSMDDDVYKSLLSNSMGNVYTKNIFGKNLNIIQNKTIIMGSSSDTGVMLPIESFIRCDDISKLSDISTTTSLHSAMLAGQEVKDVQTPTAKPTTTAGATTTTSGTSSGSAGDAPDKPETPPNTGVDTTTTVTSDKSVSETIEGSVPSDRRKRRNQMRSAPTPTTTPTSTDSATTSSHKKSGELSPDNYSKIKSLYSIYSLLCISNNINQNYIAYLELKLGVELDLERLIFNYIPMNSLVLLKRRLMHQLGVNLLYKLLGFMPDMQQMGKRLALLSFMCDYAFSKSKMRETERSTESKSAKASDKKSNTKTDKVDTTDNPDTTDTYEFNFSDKNVDKNTQYRLMVKENPERRMRELIKKLVKYLNYRCNPVYYNENHVSNFEQLKAIINAYNMNYTSNVKVINEIDRFLAKANPEGEDEEDTYELNKLIDVNSDLMELINQIKSKLYLLFFPYITTFALSSIYSMQSYVPYFVDMSKHNVYSGGGHIDPKKPRENDDSDIQLIFHIYKYIKYKIINLWKLFIMYYYFKTSSNLPEECASPSYPAEEACNLIEIYVKFNATIETMEKIHKVIALSTPAHPVVPMADEIVSGKDRYDDLQLCCLIKNSLSAINIRFI